MQSAYSRRTRRRRKPDFALDFKFLLKTSSTILVLVICTAIAITAIKKNPEKISIPHPVFGYLPPLVMKDGDPHIRALMRTISASESNAKNPYVLLYGGQHTHDLSRHPNTCIAIKTDINQGHCSTAAGRYQFLTKTWREKAALYHPQRQLGKSHYDFESESQDLVTYQWLMDKHRWGMNFSEQLKQGNIEPVLKKLSGTWTSLGHGIEDNRMTASLPKIYQKLLAEELDQAN
jgi:nickel/cobalt tolerance cation efflux system protein